MTYRHAKRVVHALALCLATATCTQDAGAQAWKPDKNVEVVVGTGPGGALDRATRTLQKLMQERRLVPSSTVVNKPGGGHAVALTYLNQHPGDAHYLQVTSEPFLTNKITGKSQIAHTEYTAIARLFSEYMAFAVHAEGRVRTGQGVIEAIRADPGALSVSVSTSVGNANHIALALVAKAVGHDPRRLKTVVFNSAGDALTAPSGRHIDMIVTGPASIVPHHRAGKLRIVAIAAPSRLHGALAEVPTWKEQGVDVVADTWRVLVAPRALSAAQIAYWDEVLARLTQSDEWRSDLERNLFSSTYTGSSETRRFLDMQQERLRVVLTELGLAKWTLPAGRKGAGYEQ